MRASHPFLALPLAFGFLSCAGCLVSDPEPEDWLGVGFRTPEQTFRTFQTALAGDRPELEYRALASSFKKRMRDEGLPASLLGYLEFRDTVPEIRYLARAEERLWTDVAPDRKRLLAEIDFLFVHRAFEIDFVREDYWELYAGEERVDDAAERFDHTVRLSRPVAGGPPVALEASIPLMDYVEPERVSEVRIGREWKIDGFAEIETDELEAPMPPAPEPTEP